MAFLVIDSYDTWHLWRLPPTILAAFDRLDLFGPLGHNGVADAARYVQVIRSTNFTLVPVNKQERSNVSATNNSPSAMLLPVTTSKSIRAPGTWFSVSRHETNETAPMEEGQVPSINWALSARALRGKQALGALLCLRLRRLIRRPTFSLRHRHRLQ